MRGQKVNRPSASSTPWISAQPVSRFAPPEAWATVHAEPHAPRESQHLRLLNLQVYDRKVNLCGKARRAPSCLTRRRHLTMPRCTDRGTHFTSYAMAYSVVTSPLA